MSRPCIGQSFSGLGTCAPATVAAAMTTAVVRSIRMLSLGFPVVPEDERAPLCRRDDLGTAVFVEIDDGEMRADAGAIVDQLGHELRTPWSLRVAYRAIDVEHRRAMRVRIDERIEMGPEALTGDEILQSVAVHIRIGRTVELREDHPTGIL